jgi:hypothetical protein
MVVAARHGSSGWWWLLLSKILYSSCVIFLFVWSGKQLYHSLLLLGLASDYLLHLLGC